MVGSSCSGSNNYCSVSSYIPNTSLYSQEQMNALKFFVDYILLRDI